MQGFVPRPRGNPYFAANSIAAVWSSGWFPVGAYDPSVHVYGTFNGLFRCYISHTNSVVPSNSQLMFSMTTSGGFQNIAGNPAYMSLNVESYNSGSFNAFVGT